MIRLLKEAEKYTIYVTLFLLPLAFSPMFFNGFLTVKVIILVLGVSLALALRLIRTAATGSFEFNQGSFDLPLFILALAFLLSGIYSAPNKAEAFFLPGTATVVISGIIMYFLLNQQESESKDKLIYIILGSSFVSAFIYLIALTGLFEKISSLPEFMKSKNFTTMGGLLPLAMYLLPAIVYGLGQITKSKDYLVKVMLGSLTAILAVTLIIASFNIFTDKSNFKIATVESSLAVAFDSLKTSALLGVGPSNYLSAYTRFRPISVNSTDDWTSRYTQARDFFLTVITETGFAGTFALILLAIVVGKMVNNEIKSRERARLSLIDSRIAAIFVLSVLLLILPAPSPEIYLLLFIGLALSAKTRKFRLGVSALAQQVHVGDSKASRVPAVIAITPLLLGIGYILFTGSRAVAAERSFKVALDQLATNKGTDAYQSLQSAINTMPSIDRYHSTYSQVNFLLASAVARKKDLTDSDRQTITQLIQQAIREAKSTVALNPQRAGNWEILGNTYKNIMALSQGADKFAIQSYSQAVALDPINPDLRVSLGGIYFAQKDYDSAIDTFKLAVLAKPDHANSRYNLSAAYREKGDITKAIAEMQAVLQIVKPGTKDYDTAKKELEDLQSKKQTAQPDGETLKNPPTNTKAINPAITLPQDSAPQNPLPTATPQATPSPTPNQ